MPENHLSTDTLLIKLGFIEVSANGQLAIFAIIVLAVLAGIFIRPAWPTIIRVLKQLRSSSNHTP